MIDFITAQMAKDLADHAKLNIRVYEQRLAKMIKENAELGNTCVFTVLPKHLALDDIRQLSARLTQLGYHVRFEVDEFYYSFNVFWI